MKKKEPAAISRENWEEKREGDLHFFPTAALLGESGKPGNGKKSKTSMRKKGKGEYM